jgi:sporulation protein YlmC with PRC-barrel domain
VRASDLLGRYALDADGHRLGRVVDLVCEDGVLLSALVVRGPWGRLLGYERDQEVRGPWVIEVAARKILRRNTTTVPWESLRLEPTP